jgi:hypothetical protein
MRQHSIKDKNTKRSGQKPAAAIIKPAMLKASTNNSIKERIIITPAAKPKKSSSFF